MARMDANATLCRLGDRSRGGVPPLPQCWPEKRQTIGWLAMRITFRPFLSELPQRTAGKWRDTATGDHGDCSTDPNGAGAGRFLILPGNAHF